MILVSIHSAGAKLRCELTQGRVCAEGEASTFVGVLAKTYLKLLIRKFRTIKRREAWKER